jgi:hypothetical protein
MIDQDKIKEFLVDVIEFMLTSAGHPDVTYQYLIDNPEIEGKKWFQYYTITKEQEQEVKEYFIKNHKKLFKMPVFVSEKSWLWFNLMWGLKLIEDDNKGQDTESDKE